VWPLIVIGLLSAAILIGIVLWTWIRAGTRADQVMEDHDEGPGPFGAGRPPLPPNP
jgi:hypothetical protein